MKEVEDVKKVFSEKLISNGIGVNIPSDSIKSFTSDISKILNRGSYSSKSFNNSFELSDTRGKLFEGYLDNRGMYFIKFREQDFSENLFYIIDFLVKKTYN